MQLAKFIVRLSCFIKGPYKVIFSESNGFLKNTFLRVSGGPFEMLIFFEINTYRTIYKRWFIPNKTEQVLCLGTSFTGEPPTKLRIACCQTLCLPYQGNPLTPPSRYLYNASNLYLDVLRQRSAAIKNTP